MEPKHLRIMRRVADAASDEAHRIELLVPTHWNPDAAKDALRKAIATERVAWRNYARAFNQAVAENSESR